MLTKVLHTIWMLAQVCVDDKKPMTADDSSRLPSAAAAQARPPKSPLRARDDVGSVHYHYNRRPSAPTISFQQKQRDEEMLSVDCTTSMSRSPSTHSSLGNDNDVTVCHSTSQSAASIKKDTLSLKSSNGDLHSQFVSSLRLLMSIRGHWKTEILYKATR